ncbi:MAG: hypothetical protein IJZ91_04870 [Oscillospiraceae bacterium]|nr:hypothetical protein [Oscillospiraceae bacterium]
MHIDIKRQTRIIDLLAILFLTVCIGFLAFGHLNNSCQWGDDFAAYINQGIAIAEGTFDEQIRLNYLMHPSFMPDEAVDGELVYVWGYSLLHTLIYKLVGFDRVNFSSIVYYKLPTVIALTLMAGLMYLFLRRRFGVKLSLFTAIMFCTYSGFYTFIDAVISDFVFLFFALLSFYICELFLTAAGRRKTILALIWGITLWFMYEVRLNGIAVLLICALAHIIRIVSQIRKCGSLASFLHENKKELIIQLLPYIIFFALRLFSEAIFAPATSNSSDLNDTNLGIIYGNLLNYTVLFKEWYASMWGNLVSALLLFGYTPKNSLLLFNVVDILSYISFALCFVGIIFDGIKRNFHYTVFLGAYIFVASMLFYSSGMGMRYIFPTLPIMLMFTGYGFMRVVKLVKLPFKMKKCADFAAVVLTALLCFGFIYPLYSSARDNIASDYTATKLADSDNAYSPSAIEAYNFVSENIPEDSVIGYFKPRALYLNTQRRAVTLTSMLNHSLDEVDYYLIYKNMIIDPEPTEDFVAIWENQDFIMMEKQA